MTAKHDTALAWVFQDEGGYAERKEEGGGAVNMGITFAVFSAWRTGQGKPTPTFSDLRAMTREEAAAIYTAQYLAPIHFDELPAGVDYAVLDAAVNGGVTGSIKILQRALGMNEIDGHFGLVTRWAANHRDVPMLIGKLCDLRLATYKTYKTYDVPIKAGSARTWGDVWTARIGKVRARALAMVPAAATKPVVVPAVAAKPKPTETVTVAAKWLEPATASFNGLVGLNLGVAELETYLQSLKWGDWRPATVTLHNTYEPTLSQWYATPGGTPQRLRNIWVRYHKLGWRGGPHIFIEAADDDRPIWIGNPLTAKGTHSPSFNKDSWGVEMVGDFGRAPFDPAVKANTVATLAVLFRFLGVSPDRLRFHKDDPRTDHDCPGKNVKKPDMIAAIKAAM